MYHIYILIALVVLVVASFALMAWSDSGDSGVHFIGGGLGVLGLFASAVCAIGFIGGLYHWFAAEQKANIIEREYGDRYTQAEVFFASDVINTIRELDRKRVEVNGDLLRERDAQRDLKSAD